MAFELYQLHVLKGLEDGNTPVAPIPRESALKVVGEGFEPYMCSFYRLRDKDLKRKLRRGDVLRPHVR